MTTRFGRVSRAGGRGLGDGVEAEELERFRLTRQYWLGRLRGNPAAATQELKPLECIGPAQMERSDNGAIPLCESGRDGVQSNGTPSFTVSRLRPPSEDVPGTKWRTLPVRLRRASKESRRSLTSFQAGLVRTQWSACVMESVPVLPIGSGEPRFSGRKACEAWMNEPLLNRYSGSGR